MGEQKKIWESEYNILSDYPTHRTTVQISRISECGSKQGSEMGYFCGLTIDRIRYTLKGIQEQGRRGQKERKQPNVAAEKIARVASWRGQDASLYARWSARGWDATSLASRGGAIGYAPSRVFA
jgi:hypothetical protein